MTSANGAHLFRLTRGAISGTSESQVKWCMPVMAALRRQGQGAHKDNLGYIVKQWELVSRSQGGQERREWKLKEEMGREREEEGKEGQRKEEEGGEDGR